MNQELVDKIFWNGVLIPLEDYILIEVTGTDNENFLQGQSTNNVKAIKAGEGQLNSVLNIQGKVEGFFFIFKNNKSLFMAIEKNQKELILERLNKYIIMDDVEFVTHEKSLKIMTGTKSLVWYKERNEEDCFLIPYCNDVVVLSWSGEVDQYFDKLNNEEHEQWKFFSLWPKSNEVIGEFIHESLLNKLAIDYQKGCFLGQEVVAKIENNRGAPFANCLLESLSKESTYNKGETFSEEGKELIKFTDKLEVGSKTFYQGKVFRDRRVEGAKTGDFLVKTYGHAVVHYNLMDKIKGLYLYSLDLYNHKNDKEGALNYLDVCLLLDENFVDAYEMAGVIHGQSGEYAMAIEYMDRLHKIDDKNIMAHTNKSLYYMKMGVLDKAEDEKAKATVLSFQQSGVDENEIEVQQKAEDERKEKMFLAVLEIDKSDETAHYGLGELALKRGQYLKAIDHFKLVLENNSKFSTAYLNLGKSYISVNKKDEAKEIFEKGILIAAKLGDMMPANEMQRLLTNI